jgi:DNA-binding helix-hairpin-helix protein with protein kinase domain
VIGDINHSGVLVSPDATMRLIDADSFQISNGSQTFFCRVGTPEYTPAELQGKRLGSVLRTVNHDAFGLAVTLFQLLWMGRHPFAGVPSAGEMPIEQAIREGKFPYTRASCRGLAPPPSAPGLDEFPAALGNAFERAFHNKGLPRPTAAEWLEVLKETEANLKQCSKNKRHYYPGSAKECLWCRVEERQAVFLFPTAAPTITVADPGAANFKLDAIWASISAIKLPPNTELPKVAASTPQPSKQAMEARKGRLGKKLVACAVLFGAAVTLVVYPGAWIIWVAAGWWAFVNVATSGSVPPSFKKRAEELDQKWEAAIQEWRQRPKAQFDRVLAELTDAKTRYESLSKREAAEVAQIQQRHHNAELQTYLQNELLSQYAIPGVGPGRMATLHSRGIRTAADVTNARLLNIPGFGPTLAAPLLHWRALLEQRFRLKAPLTPAEMADIQAVRIKFAREAAELRSKLASGPLRLRQICNGLQQNASVDPTLNQLHQARLQAHADARFLGITVVQRPTGNLAQGGTTGPSKPTFTPVRPPYAAPSRKTASQPTTRPPAHSTGTPACPRCGSAMVRRTARRGRNRGNQFWGCSRYFSGACNGTRPI